MAWSQDRQQQRALAFDCHEALARLYYCLDESRYTDLAAVFAEDGVWHRQGKALKGRAEILSALRARPATQITRHIITNIWVTAAPDASVEAVGYLTTYVHNSGEAVPKPIAIRYPARLFVMKTRFRCSGDGSLIAEHKVSPEFEFPKNA